MNKPVVDVMEVLKAILDLGLKYPAHMDIIGEYDSHCFAKNTCNSELVCIVGEAFMKCCSEGTVYGNEIHEALVKADEEGEGSESLCRFVQFEHKGQLAQSSDEGRALVQIISNAVYMNDLEKMWLSVRLHVLREVLNSPYSPSIEESTKKAIWSHCYPDSPYVEECFNMFLLNNEGECHGL